MNENGELLLLRRSEEAHCPRLWAFPGGKIETGESALQAAGRELKEEAELIGEHWRQLAEFAFDYPDRRLNFLLFNCLCLDISRLCAESEHAWVSVADLDRYPMPAANTELVLLLKKALGDTPGDPRT